MGRLSDFINRKIIALYSEGYLRRDTAKRLAVMQCGEQKYHSSGATRCANCSYYHITSETTDI